MPVMPCRIALRHDDREQVRREDHGLGAVQAGLSQLVHVAGIGRRKDVGGRALRDLLHERRRRVEAERHLRVGVGRRERGSDVVEGGRERRRREDGDVSRNRRGGRLGRRGGRRRVGARRRRRCGRSAVVATGRGEEPEKTEEEDKEEPAASHGRTVAGDSQPMNILGPSLTKGVRMRLSARRRRDRGHQVHRGDPREGLRTVELRGVVGPSRATASNHPQRTSSSG